jgi:hypothetical protein
MHRVFQDFKKDEEGRSWRCWTPSGVTKIFCRRWVLTTQGPVAQPVSKGPTDADYSNYSFDHCNKHSQHGQSHRLSWITMMNFMKSAPHGKWPNPEKKLVLLPLIVHLSENNCMGFMRSALHEHMYRNVNSPIVTALSSCWSEGPTELRELTMVCQHYDKWVHEERSSWNKWNSGQ